MALRAGTAYVDIAAKVAPGFNSDVEKGIAPGVSSAGDKAGGILGGSFKKAAAVAAGGVLAAKATDFLRGAVDAARESAKIAAQTEQVVKSTDGAAKVSADHVGDLAGSIAKITGVDDEAIQSAENLLLTFTGVRNEVGKGNKVFDQATKAIVDMSAVQGSLEGNSIMVGKALQDPIKGLAALSRVGVKFTDDQKAMIEQMVKAGDVAGAQKVILAELGTEFGGQAAAQATSAQKLGVAWGNVQEAIGAKLIPVLDKVSGFLAEHTSLILPLVGLIAGALVVAFTAWAISALSAAAATIAAAAPVLAVIAVIALLVAGIVLLVKNWDTIWSKIKEIAASAASAIGGAIGHVVDFFKELPGKILGALADLPGKMLDFGAKLIAKLVQGITGAAGKVAGAIGGAIKGAASHVPVVGGLFKAAGGPVSSSRPYIVGERGPELFMPRVSGGIVTNDAILNALGGSGGSSGGPLVGELTINALERDDPWYVGSTLNRTLRELAYAEGWSA